MRNRSSSSSKAARGRARNPIGKVTRPGLPHAAHRHARRVRRATRARDPAAGDGPSSLLQEHPRPRARPDCREGRTGGRNPSGPARIAIARAGAAQRSYENALKTARVQQAPSQRRLRPPSAAVASFSPIRLVRCEMPWRGVRLRPTLPRKHPYCRDRFEKMQARAGCC